MKAEISFTPEDLEQIRLLIRDELSKSTPTKEAVKYYTIEETCELLKISKPTFHNWKNKHVIKTEKIQGRVLISASEVFRITNK